MVRSPWPAEPLAFDFGAVTGWRMTLLDEAGAEGDAQVALPQTVSTVYVADARRRCVVVTLSSLLPLAAAVVQTHAERLIASFDIAEGATPGA
mgnify:FL=1